MSESMEYKVEAGEHGRVDVFIRRRMSDVGRRWIGALFHGGLVRIDGRKAKKGDPVAVGAVVSVGQLPPKPGSVNVVPDLTSTITVLHEDAHVIVVSKPPGIPSHPLKPGERGTAANAVVARYPECAEVGRDPREAGLAHRLDTGTSGVLLCARDSDTWRALRTAFRDGRVDKAYVALVHGPIDNEGTVMASLAQRGRRVVVDDIDGLPAETSWRVLARNGEHSLVRCEANTGRMHQIRAHLSHIGAPIVGDTLYGGPASSEVIGHFLHASRLRVVADGAGAISVTAPLPPDRLRALATAGIDPAAIKDG